MSGNDNNNAGSDVTKQDNALSLDWTQLGTNNDTPQRPIRYPSDVADFVTDNGTDNDDDECEEICIVGTAGQKITNIGKDFSSSVLKTKAKSLKRLILRSHVIRIMEGFENLTQLELLELYDNQVEILSSLEGPGPTLRVLDMSYNVIREMKPVEQCPNLQELYLANNKLKTMAGLSQLTKLRKIDLGANRLREIQDLENLVNLEELWLGKNKIESIQGLENLIKLRRLDIQSNRITVVTGLESQQETLEELYLAHNGINDDGIADLPKLQFVQLSVLDFSRNQITDTAPMSHITTLEELWLSGNKIEDFEKIEPLRALKNLDTVYLEYNPLQQQDPLYRKRVKECIPSLSQIDATMIGSGVSSVVAAATTSSSKNTNSSGVAPVLSPPEEIKRLQDLIIERAKAETKGQK